MEKVNAKKAEPSAAAGIPSSVSFADSCLAAARSRHGSDLPPAGHSLPRRRFATQGKAFSRPARRRLPSPGGRWPGIYRRVCRARVPCSPGWHPASPASRMTDEGQSAFSFIVCVAPPHAVFFCLCPCLWFLQLLGDYELRGINTLGAHVSLTLRLRV